MSETKLPKALATHYERCVGSSAATAVAATFEQSGELRLGPNAQWMPFTAEQHMSADRTEFLWHARCKMAPLVTAVIEDAYEGGHGRLDAKIWGLVSVAHERGVEIDRGEAQRYLAELAWCPMALVHNPELQFEERPDGIVRVWVHDPQTYIDLSFDDAGDIVGVRTTTRARAQQKEPWEGRFTDYRDFGNVRIPAKAEVWWYPPDAPFVYWRGKVTEWTAVDGAEDLV